MLKVLKGEAKAEYLMELSNKKMDEADSYKMEQNTFIKFELDNVLMEQKNTLSLTCVDDGETYFREEKNKSEMWVGDAEKTVWYRDVGYSDGMMFTQYQTDSEKNRLKSPISEEDFRAWLEQRSDDVPEPSVTEDTCKTITCMQSEDGAWTITCEDFTEEGLEPFRYLIREMEQAFTEEYDITDVHMTATLDKDFYPASIAMEYEFTEKDNATARMPELSVKATYGSWNSVTEEEAVRKLGAYDEVEDIRLIEKFLTTLSDRKSAQSGSFTAATNVIASYEGEEFRSETIQDVTFTGGEDYTYTLDYAEDGSVYDIDYKNGKLTTRVTDQGSGILKDKKTEDMSRGTAQLTVNQLMDPETFSGLDFESVTCVDAEAGIYRFGMSSAYRKEMAKVMEESFEGAIKDMEGYVEAVIVDGVLKSYTCHVDVTVGLSITSYLEMKMNVLTEISVTFHDEAESENTADV